MLEEITIRDLGVISTADLSFGPGLTVITGETGAGKTMVLTGLSFLLGAKSDPSVVRVGAEAASVQGRVRAQGRPDWLAAKVEDSGGLCDEDGSVLLGRTVGANRSRAYLGGRAVPQAILGQIAQELVTVHGQSDQQRLRLPQHQRAALDKFAGATHLQALEDYRQIWRELTQTKTELEELTAQTEQRQRQAELLRVGLAEVTRIDPQAGEDEELSAEAARLTHAVDLKMSLTQAHQLLTGDEVGTQSANNVLHAALVAIEQASSLDGSLAPLAKRLKEAILNIDDLALDLASQAENIAPDPARLEVVQQRRSELIGLMRTHGVDLPQVLEWAQQAERDLLNLEQDDDHLNQLRDRIQNLQDTLIAQASALSVTRQRAAGELAKAVSEELASLAMPQADFRVQVTSDLTPGPYGQDEVEFLLSAHRGGQLAPVTKGASGGELSRVMLAIEVALAQVEHGSGEAMPTFVFDEVDAGIGGKTAVEVGRRLAKLATQTQVVVVTHLAQVAAFATNHIVVRKDEADHSGITESDVQQVSGQERVAELARMLSGQQDSEVARAHAVELLDLAGVA